jgi:hypothetical protein
MQLWGGYPAGKRTIYSVDYDKNVFFPASIGVTGNAKIDGTLEVDGTVQFDNNVTFNQHMYWQPSKNIYLYQTANGQEWSFDIHRQGNTGGYWHVWDSEFGSILKVEAESKKVVAPYLLYEGGNRVYSAGNKPSLATIYNNETLFTAAGSDPDTGGASADIKLGDTIEITAGAGIDVYFDEHNKKWTISNTYSDDTVLTAEQVQDIVGAMFSGNTETRISATYQDEDGTIDLVVDDMTYTLTKAAVEAVLTGNITSHTHDQYLTAITKAMIESVLTGTITTHGHNYDNYDNWKLSVGGQSGGAAREQQSGMTLTLTAGNNIDLYYDDVGNQVYISFYHEGEVDIASGDHLMIADNSDSNKMKRSDITFGADDGTFLAKDGNFKSPGGISKTTLYSTAFSFSTTSVSKTMSESITGKTIYVAWSLNSDYNECYVSAFQFHSHDNSPLYGFATYYSGYPIQGYNWRLVSTSSTSLSFSTGQSWYITPSGSYTSMGNSTQTVYIKEIYTYD